MVTAIDAFVLSPPPSELCGLYHDQTNYTNPGQDYNAGDGARLPYATECTVAPETCNSAGLMEWLDNPSSAEGLDLELAQNAEADAAVGEVTNCTVT